MPVAELGLDSLAIVHLVTAVEAAFGVEVAERILTAETSLSLQQMADEVDAAPRGEVARRAMSGNGSDGPQMVHRIERLEHRLASRGAAGRLAWAILRRAWPWLRWLYTPSSEYVILERPLDGSLPIATPPPGVVLRPYRSADRAALVTLWPPFLAATARAEVDRWLRHGASALVAVEDERIVGLTVYSGDARRGTPLLRRGRPACWGHYLREAPDARGRGIGLALLIRSLHDARAAGFGAQLSSVYRENAPMLAAATQLAGFRPIGGATRTHRAGRTHWRGRIDGRSGSGSTLPF